MKASVSPLFRVACLLGVAVGGFSLSDAAFAEGSKEPSITTPGPDLANFPNSAFTLPQGRAYVEAVPFNYTRKTSDPNGDPSQTSFGGYLLRYGLTDDFELRLLSDGYTVQRGGDRNSGLSPQTLDLKWHIADENKESFLPAVGIEFAVQTTWASRALQSGVQPSVSFNFDQTLPGDIAFEYNVGALTQEDGGRNHAAQMALSWAFQKEVVDQVAVFANGFTNTGQGAATSAVGGGIQWTPTPRTALFTNISGGLNSSTPKLSALLGFAVAF